MTTSQIIFACDHPATAQNTIVSKPLKEVLVNALQIQKAENKRKYYEENREKIAENMRKYYEENREKYLEYQRGYREKKKNHQAGCAH